MTPEVIKLRSKPTNITSKNAWYTLLFIIPNESNKPTQQTISFWLRENVVYAIFKANAWRGVTAVNCPVVLTFHKRRIRRSCYVIICCLFWNLVTIVIAFVPVHVYTLKFWENKERFIIFLKNAYSAFFSTLKRSYLWKMRGYPQFSFWISIAADMIYLSHIVIIWEKILSISGHRP